MLARLVALWHADRAQYYCDDCAGWFTIDHFS
jgi:hypothetical protein